VVIPGNRLGVVDRRRCA